MTRKKLYTIRRDINITPEQEKKLERLAKEKNLRVNQVVRDTIDAYQPEGKK